MKNVLNKKVSVFKNYVDVIPEKEINLYEWLLLQTNDEVKLQIERLRQMTDKKERDKAKSRLECVTISGIFKPDRRQCNLVEHSGLISIDIDAKDNLHFSNLAFAKKEISKIRHVAYCGLSASGKGLFAIIPILYLDKHRLHFEQLRLDFADAGVYIDKACPNLDRLRGLSYDATPYFNIKAEVYPYLHEESTAQRPSHNNSYASKNKSDIDFYIKELISKGVDITQGYDRWLRIGFALVNEYGEDGRQYYHAISSISPQYEPIKTDKQYTNCMNAKGNGVHIGTLYAYFKEAGIIKNNMNTGFNCNFSSRLNNNQMELQKTIKDDIMHLPGEWRRMTMKRNIKNPLRTYFNQIFGDKKTEECFLKYNIAMGKNNDLLFWYRDIKDLTRECKSVTFTNANGELKMRGECFVGKDIAMHFNNKNIPSLTPCYFGEDLLKGNNKMVCIVESEKTAMIGSILYPVYIWIATGGIHGCKMNDPEVNKIFIGRKVVLFPDLGTFDKWSKFADEMRKQGLDVSVSTLLENNATEEQKKVGLDIANYILGQAQLPNIESNILSVENENLQITPQESVGKSCDEDIVDNLVKNANEFQQAFKEKDFDRADKALKRVRCYWYMRNYLDNKRKSRRKIALI